MKKDCLDYENHDITGQTCLAYCQATKDRCRIEAEKYNLTCLQHQGHVVHLKTTQEYYNFWDERLSYLAPSREDFSLIAIDEEQEETIQNNLNYELNRAEVFYRITNRNPPSNFAMETKVKCSKIYRIMKNTDQTITIAEPNNMAWFLVHPTEENTSPILLWKSQVFNMAPSQMINEWSIYEFKFKTNTDLVVVTPGFGFIEVEHVAEMKGANFTPSFITPGEGDNGVIAKALQQLNIDGYHEYRAVNGGENNPEEIVLTNITKSINTTGNKIPWDIDDVGFLDYRYNL